MSKLDELIQKLCPDGVEYRKIGEVTNYEQPSKYIVRNTDYRDEYETPVLTAGQSFVLGYTNESDGIYPASKATPVIIFDDFTAAFKWVNFPFKVKSSAMKMITANESQLLIRFLFHWMGALNYSSTEHTRLWIGTYSEFKIPVPPLPVQREIVRILDNFTELTARKQQYAYYRDKLFDSYSEVDTKKIGKLTRVFSASRVHKDEWTNEGVPFFRSSDVVSAFNGGKNTRGKAYISRELYERLSAKSGKIEKDDILVTGGGTIGIPYIIPNDAPIYVKDADLICIKRNEHILSKFLYHYFCSTKFRDYLKSITHNATIAHYTITQIENTPVPVFPLKEQARIVSILDRFDTLCTDLSSGLPAEIEARQKQYEYYRDKLLTFTPAD